MSEARAAVALNDRFFARFPVAPALVGATMALAFVAFIVVISAVAGGLIELLDRDVALWRNRDARIAFVIALLAAYLPTARRYATLEIRERLPEIGALVGRQLSPRALRFSDGLFGIAIVPIMGISIDGDPSTYFEEGYWRVETFWHWGAGAFATWHAGLLLGTTFRESLRVSSLADQIREIDLLDLSNLRPFAQMGQRFALLQIGIAAIFSMNVVEVELARAIVIIFALTFAYALFTIGLPALGVNRRIRSEKQREIARVSAAIRGETGALVGSALEARSDDVSVTDLLSYRRTVETVSEWPIDAPMRLRILLYAAIPVVSWFGSVLVEWLLDRWTG